MANCTIMPKYRLGDTIWYWDHWLSDAKRGVVWRISYDSSGIVEYTTVDSVRVREEKAYATEQECIDANASSALQNMVERREALKAQLDAAKRDLDEVTAQIEKIKLAKES